MTTKKVIYEDDKLLEEEINDKKYKVRAILMNEKKEVVLEQYAGIYMFPGGSIEKGENPIISLKREIEEETGIDEILIDEIPFLEVEEYTRNFPKRDGIHFVNRYTKTLFYFAMTTKKIDGKKRHLTPLEKNFEFTAHFVPITSIPKLLKEKKINNFKEKYFLREISTVLQYVPKEKILEE